MGDYSGAFPSTPGNYCGKQTRAERASPCNQPLFVTLDNTGNVWFTTPNNSMVARIAKLDTANNNQISEHLIRSSLPGSLTPHLLTLDANGHPWWTEGWVRAVSTLDPQVATSGVCGTSVGDCTGVTEVALQSPPPTLG